MITSANNRRSSARLDISIKNQPREEVLKGEATV